MSPASHVSPGSAPSRRRPARSFVVVALVAVAALLVSGCNSGAAWIARVDGKVVDSPNFWAGVPHFAAYASAVNQTQPPTTAVPGVNDIAVAGSYAGFLVQLDALKTLNARHGTKVPESSVTAARQVFTKAPYDTLPDWFVDQLATAQANYEALRDYYAKGADTTAAVQAYYDANKEQFRQACFDVIPGSDESELVEARTRIEEGADFATVAKAVAAAQPPGADGTVTPAEGENQDGDVGCWGVANMSRLFATTTDLAQILDAEPNALVGPLAIAGGGVALFRVRSTSYQPLEEVAESIQSMIGEPGQQEASNALTDFLVKAKVELNPRVGTWNAEVNSWSTLGLVIPPVGAEQPAGADDQGLLDLQGALG